MKSNFKSRIQKIISLSIVSLFAGSLIVFQNCSRQPEQQGSEKSDSSSNSARSYYDSNLPQKNFLLQFKNIPNNCTSIWDENRNPCDWSRTDKENKIDPFALSAPKPIECDSDNNIIGLHLGYCHFFGQFPEGIEVLSELKVLEFPNNYFTGSIPESFSSLRNLRVLNMGYGGFEGPVPSSLKNLTNLESIEIGVFDQSYDPYDDRSRRDKYLTTVDFNQLQSLLYSEKLVQARIITHCVDYNLAKDNSSQNYNVSYSRKNQNQYSCKNQMEYLPEFKKTIPLVFHHKLSSGEVIDRVPAGTFNYFDFKTTNSINLNMVLSWNRYLNIYAYNPEDRENPLGFKLMLANWRPANAENGYSLQITQDLLAPYAYYDQVQQKRFVKLKLRLNNVSFEDAPITTFIYNE